MLSSIVYLTLFAFSGAQLVGHSLQRFGTSNPVAPASSASVPPPSASYPSNGKVEVPWKQAAARLAAKLNVSRSSSGWEQHKQSEAVESQIKDLKHAQGALGYLEERAANKLQADVDEVDHLLVRRHLLTDKKAENAKDIATIESHAAALKEVSIGLEKSGNAGEMQAINTEIADLSLAAKSLRGTPGEVEQLGAEINSTTSDGRKMDAMVRHLSKERLAIGRQIQVLTQEGDELQDTAETARDFEAFERAGIDMDEQDDPYVKEAQQALEKASGWNKNDLDAQAVKAREVMTKGIAKNPGEGLRALKAVRPYSRFLL